MDELYIKKLFANTYQKYIFNLKLGRTELVAYFSGQLEFILNNFRDYLGTDEEITMLKNKSEANALEHIEFYSKSNILDVI